MEEIKKQTKNLLSMKSILVLCLVVIIVANIVVWVNYLNRQSQVESLTGEIISVKADIRRTTPPTDDLEVRLKDARQAMVTAKRAFPASVETNDVMNYIIDLAGECNVQVIPLVSEGWHAEGGGASYHVLGLNGTAHGTISDIRTFMYKLQHNTYKTLEIKGLTITPKSQSYTSGPTFDNSLKVAVQFSISLYTCPSTGDEETV
jgi:hypothetical protein